MSKKNKIQNIFLEELKRIPIVLVACEKNGISRNSVYRWKKDDKIFSQAMDEALAEGEALVNDMSESQLLTLIKEKNWQAISFWLRHRNPRFRDKIEVTSKIEDSEELTPSQAEVVRQALKLARILPVDEQLINNKKHMILNQMIPRDLVEQMTKDKKVRTAITKESFSYFFHFYYAHYVKYATADFQKEIIGLIEKSDKDSLFVVAFRGSGKSTIVTAAYPIWAILGKQEKKFVVIFCQTQAQAKQHMMNLRRELEDNELLKKDLGPFRENSDEWGAQSIVFSNTDARITVASVDQSIRGIRHYQYRPDLVICDDVEDISSTKTRDSRNKTYQWLKSEVIPAGDRNTRLIIVGNLLHEDSLLMRLKEENEKDIIDGKFLYFPLVDKKGKCLWPGKYPTQGDVDKERKNVGSEITWQQEYLLNIVPSEDQAIFKEWINYYDEIPARLKLYGGYTSHLEVRIGIDPAISKSDVADYTAMVPGLLYETHTGYRLYILPKIINKRLSFPETVDTCKTLYQSYKKDYEYPKFIIEDVAYQKALPQQLQAEGIPNVMTTRPGNQDKRSRLVILANMIKTGQILFPREGAEELIQQIVHFGVEKHDDLVDAFANLAHNMLEKPPRTARFYVIG